VSRPAARARPRDDRMAAEVARLASQVARLVEVVEARLPAPEPVEDDDDAGDVSVAEAARLAGRSTQTLRRWCDDFGVGKYSDAAGCYLVCRAKLRAHLVGRYGAARLPAGLRHP